MSKNLVAAFIHKKGARLIGGIGILSLVKINIQSGLGEKEEVSCLAQEQDQVIFRSVIMQGTWETHTANFLANELISHP